MEKNNGGEGWSVLVFWKWTIYLLSIVFWTTELQDEHGFFFSFVLFLAFVCGAFIWSFCPQTQFTKTIYISPSLFQQNMRLSWTCPCLFLPQLPLVGPPMCCVQSPSFKRCVCVCVWAQSWHQMASLITLHFIYLVRVSCWTQSLLVKEEWVSKPWPAHGGPHKCNSSFCTC